MPHVIARLGNDVSTDVIYPGRYMATVLPTETPQYAFANDPELNEKLRKPHGPDGPAIVAGKNFGCGSSREQAVSALTGCGLTIVAEGIARIFLQNAINLGLNVVVAPGFTADEGDEVVFERGGVENRTKRTAYDVVPLPFARQAIIDAGGLIAFTRARLVAARGAAAR